MLNLRIQLPTGSPVLHQKGPDEATLTQVNDVIRAYRDDVHRDTGPIDLLERSLHLRVTTYTHDPTEHVFNTTTRSAFTPRAAVMRSTERRFLANSRATGTTNLFAS